MEKEGKKVSVRRKRSSLHNCSGFGYINYPASHSLAEEATVEGRKRIHVRLAGSIYSINRRPFNSKHNRKREAVPSISS